MVKIHLYIKRLLEANPMAKIVLYTPYKKVADHVGEVLNEMKLEFITLSGNLKKQNQLLSNFKESGRVILVHDKVGLSGIYLSSATHMLLLHPVGIDEEMRALRMLRNVDTREREVKIVKFITKGTIEEEINEIKSVKETLKEATPVGHEITLIAVSKMQPIEAIKSAYSLGQRDFGENYIQELTEKATALQQDCPEIKWHFIGALQSNKIAQLIKIGKGLKAIQTVDSLSKFDKIWRAIHNSELREIDLFLQVNISGEESKHGLKGKDEIIEIYRHYLDLNQQQQPHSGVTLRGLMMIGEIEEAERDFNKMIQLSKELADEIGWKDCKLSMGMSGDFELAARMGTDIVRVGSAIFGQRNK